MTVKTITVLLSGIVAIATLAGCGSGPYAPKHNPNPKQETERLIFIDKKPSKVLKFVREVEPKRLPGGELEVSMILVNEKSYGGFLGLGGKRDIECDVKVQFFDATGKMVDQTTWKPRRFHRGMEESITDRSLSVDVVDYRVNVRMRQ